MIAASLLCLAHAVYWEARSEPIAGQLAVAQVVLTRVEHDAWPDGGCEVVHDPAQLSVYWDGEPETVTGEDPALVLAERLAQAGTNGHESRLLAGV